VWDANAQWLASVCETFLRTMNMSKKQTFRPGRLGAGSPGTTVNEAVLHNIITHAYHEYNNNNKFLTPVSSSPSLLCSYVRSKSLSV